MKIAIVPRVSGIHAPVPPNVMRLTEAIGATPVVLPVGFSLDGLERCSALLLQGGDDAKPLYRALELTAAGDHRDVAEYAAIQLALQLDLPVLGICRGMQVINRYFGGDDETITEILSGVSHGSSSEWTQHDVMLEPKSQIASRFGDVALDACSSHHSRVLRRIGLGLRAVGHSRDGRVEAIEAVGGEVFGVQWHPEDTAGSDDSQRWLVRKLIAAP